jgi:putative integral membrane protein (TIGR02587 family)
MRGVAGGTLLGVPLLYTQEVWLHGVRLSSRLILFTLVVTFCLDVALSYFIGFRTGRTHRPFEDAVQGFGLSAILAALLLLLIGRIDVRTDLENTLGIVALTSVPVSLGFAIGAALAPPGGGAKVQEIRGGAGDLLLAAGGAVIFALNIAPTEEPILLAAQMGWVRLGLVVGASLVLPYLIVFYAEFGGRDQRAATDGATQGPAVETLLAYAVAFGASALMLAMFGRIDSLNGAALAGVVTLAFPTSLGAALGRVLL